MQRVDSLEKTLMLGGIGGRRRRGRQRMRWLDGITNLMDVSLSTPGVGDGQGGLACWNSWGRKESDTTERLNQTELIQPPSVPLKHTSNMTEKGFLAHFILPFHSTWISLPVPPFLVLLTCLKKVSTLFLAVTLPLLCVLFQCPSQ